MRKKTSKNEFDISEIEVGFLSTLGKKHLFPQLGTS